MAWDSAFEVAFHPRTIAIVGVSSKPRSSRSPGLSGLGAFRRLREAGFEGHIYPINPKVDEVCGVTAYPSVTAVPEPIDLVIVGVPAEAVPQVLEDCIVAGALNVYVMTSGFGETGQEKGKELEETIRQIALRGKLRLLGPNCLGLHVPSAKMSTFDQASLNSGPVAFISQSGGHLATLLRCAPDFGIGFSKGISFGNALIMDSTDFLEYLGTDPETKIIAMYLEGVRDGRKLLQLVREINRHKPVIIWKGGLTDSGARAASSHTGSLRGDKQAWDAFFRQTKAIQVRSIEEMADAIMTFLCLKSPNGRSAAVISGGGGNSVAAGDICAEEGIHLPPLTPESRSKLLQFTSLVNQGIANPIDVPFNQRDPNLLRQTIETVASDPLIDTVILYHGLEIMRNTSGNRQIVECICSFAGGNLHRKPIAVALGRSRSGGELAASRGTLADRLIHSGVPVYASLARACRALLRFIEYHQTLHRL